MGSDRTADYTAKLTSSIIAAEVKVRASSSVLSEVTGCFLGMDKKVGKVISESKEAIRKNREFSDFVRVYSEISLQPVNFCTALIKGLKRGKHTLLLLTAALEQFKVEDGSAEGNNKVNKCSRTRKDLEKFRASGDPFSAEKFFQHFQSVYEQQNSMLKKLKMKESKMDKQLKYIHAWKKVSGIIFVATCASVLICSVVAAAVAAPPVAASAAALAAASSIRLRSMGKCVKSMWNSYENALRSQKEMMSTMKNGTSFAIMDLDTLRVMIEKLAIEIEALKENAERAIKKKGAVKLAIREIKAEMGRLNESVKELEYQAYECSRRILRARNAMLRRLEAS